MNHEGRSSAWGIAILLVAILLIAPPATADEFVVRTVAGLPRAGLLGGQPVAWRSYGVVAESEFLDAEARVAGCPLTPATAMMVSDRAGPACNASIGEFTPAGLSHKFELTLKLPQWREGFPFVDLALRSESGSLVYGAPGERHEGSSADLVVTQPLGAMDAFVGYSTPVSRDRTTGGWRSAFAGVTWYAARGTRLELIADRAEYTSTATLDRTVALRIQHGTPDRTGRVAAWVVRALDDRANAWQIGAGFEVGF